MSIEIETTILGGLPVFARLHVQPVEPDVGVFHPYVDEFEFFWIGGKKMRHIPDSMYDRISAREFDRVEEEAFEQ